MTSHMSFQLEQKVIISSDKIAEDPCKDYAVFSEKWFNISSVLLLV